MHMIITAVKISSCVRKLVINHLSSFNTQLAVGVTSIGYRKTLSSYTEHSDHGEKPIGQLQQLSALISTS